MKTKNYFLIKVFLIILLFSTIAVVRTFGQDTSGISGKIIDMKLQLLETRQKLIELKMELLELKPQQKDSIHKKQMDSIIQLMNKSDKKTPDTLHYKPLKTAITINLAQLFEGTLQIGYERALKNNLSIDIALSGTYVTQRGIGGRYLSSQEFGFADAITNEYIYYDGQMITGFGGFVRVKNYLLNRVKSNLKAPVGLYIAPQIMYRRIWITGTTWNYSDGSQREITRNLDVLNGGVIIGGKFCIAKVICIDAYVGGVMRLSKYYNESSLTKYKKWYNIDYSGILPTIGINVGILK